MKITGKGWVLISLGILGLAVAVLFGASAWLAIRFGVENVPASIAKPTQTDMDEAKRKLAILERTGQPQGYVDFTEAELNSLVHAWYSGSQSANERSTNIWRLKKTRFKLNERSIDCYCWVSRTAMGREWDFCWTRTAALAPGSNQWQIVLQSIRVGDVEIPYKRWPLAFNTLGMADAPMRERFQWLRQLPWVELHVDKDKPIPMFRLYNYVPPPPPAP